MRIYFFILIIFVSSINLQAQNLVANPSFEITSGCGGNGALAQATGWNCPPSAITLADLYTPCGSTGISCSNFNTLGSMAGCSNACDGSNYTGQIAYYTGCPNCREYLQRQLISPLVAGTTYNLSFKTKLAPYARYGCSRMGMLVSTTQPTQNVNQPILIIPQIEAGLITDKVNWTNVSGSFVAAGGENYVTIGVFYDNISLSIFDFGSSLSGCALASAAAYYLVDNVWIATVPSGAPPVCALNSTNCAPLPIELTKFEARYKEQIVDLNWTTASELNSDFFTVERSADGENFEFVKNINGAGKSTAIINYNSTDEKPINGLSYYRLKQNDFNGDYKYSQIVIVNQKTTINELLIQPNPAQNEIDINFNVNNPDNILIEIFDVTGKCVYHERNTANSGFNKSKHNISELNKGIYFLKLSFSEIIQSIKFVKE